MSYPSLNFALGETLDLLRDQVRTLVAREVAPRAGEIDAAEAPRRRERPRQAAGTHVVLAHRARPRSAALITRAAQTALRPAATARRAAPSARASGSRLRPK